MSEIPKKRKIVPSHLTSLNKAEITEITEVPPVDGILGKTISTIANEVHKLYTRSRTANLTDKEARILQGYIKSLVELSKEQREREKADDLANMSDEDLFALAKQIISKRESSDV